MKRFYKLAALAAAGALLAGCALNGLSKVPGVTQVNPGQIGKLEFAVGTANFGFDSNIIGLNTVTSLRQAGGLSAVLVNTPSITGPAGFTNSAPPSPAPNIAPGCQAGVETAGGDAGTNKMSGNPQNPNPNNTPAPATFGQAGGAFGYGIEPLNSTENGSKSSPYIGSPNNHDCDKGVFYPEYPTPFYLNATKVAALKANFGIRTPPIYLGGPPAYPFFKDPSFPGAMAGYSQGFDAFEAPPVAGSYTLKVDIPTGNAGTSSYSATAVLNDMTPLPNMAAPTWTSDGKGGGGGTVTVPSDARIVETMVYVYDENNGLYFSAGPLTGTGALAYTIGDNFGMCTTVGCQSTSPAPSMLPKDTILVYAASYDYPMFEASRPISTSQTPTITGGNGQADVTFSALLKSSE